MIRGLYTSTLGMTTQMKRMDVISNNIANSDTTGFKRDTVITQSFSEELMKRLNDYDASQLDFKRDKAVGYNSLGLFVDNIITDFGSGAMQRTGSPLDLAIAGEGFFAVSVTDNNGNTTEKYTRDGSFSMLSDGTLITKEGNTVLGENGAIRLPSQAGVMIDSSGNVMANDVVVDRIKMVNFENVNSLRKYGDNLYDVTDESVVSDFNGSVTQGFLEASNINVVREMVDMIAISRAYEANQKMITMIDATMGQAASDIARR